MILIIVYFSFLFRRNQVACLGFETSELKKRKYVEANYIWNGVSTIFLVATRQKNQSNLIS